MAIDKSPVLVQSIKDLVTQAVIADATDGAALKELGVKNVDTAIFCSDRKKGWTH